MSCANYSNPDFLRIADLEPAERAGLDQGATAVAVLHCQLLDRCQPTRRRSALYRPFRPSARPVAREPRQHPRADGAMIVLGANGCTDVPTDASCVGCELGDPRPGSWSETARKRSEQGRWPRNHGSGLVGSHLRASLRRAIELVRRPRVASDTKFPRQTRYAESDRGWVGMVSFQGLFGCTWLTVCHCCGRTSRSSRR